MKSTHLEDYYIIKDGKKLRYGYTTGSCATAAAKAAVQLLLQEIIDPNLNPVYVEVMTPKGILLELEAKVWERNKDRVVCSITKFAGDDPDVTDGIEVFATVTKTVELGVHIDGGVGVGRITKPGLEQPVGYAAINRVPRKMIREAVEGVIEQSTYEGGITVVIEVPDGKKIANRTFNPRLGIVDGISILGTSGIVVPMSEEALIKSIEVEMNMQVEDGAKYLLITPGNYGEAFLKESYCLDFKKHIKCSNYIGKTLEIGVNLGVKGILLVGHIGKLVKVAGGIMNTHSKEADARVELLATCALRAGGDLGTCNAILEAYTTDEALEILKTQSLLEGTMKIMLEKIEYYLQYHIANEIVVGAVVFSNKFGYLGETSNVQELCNLIRSESHE